jgi:hypothetical protein
VSSLLLEPGLDAAVVSKLRRRVCSERVDSCCLAQVRANQRKCEACLKEPSFKELLMRVDVETPVRPPCNVPVLSRACNK